MTAQIIPFPTCFQVPAHWTGTDEYIFDHLRNCGRSIDDAAAEVEQGIEAARPRYPGEDTLLRQAREAFARITGRA